MKNYLNNKDKRLGDMQNVNKGCLWVVRSMNDFSSVFLYFCIVHISYTEQVCIL